MDLNFLTKKKHCLSQRSVHTLINRYKEFGHIYSLEQLITRPTHVTCSISSFIDLFLTNPTENFFQIGIIDSEISDHQLIFCTRKVKRVKFNKHNNVVPRSLKHHTVNFFVEGLQKVNFLNYERFSNIDAAYTFLNNLRKIINETVPSKEITKNNNQDWFDREAADLIHGWEQLLLKFKKLKLHIDEEIYKKLGTKFKTLFKKEARFRTNNSEVTHFRNNTSFFIL